MSIDRAIAVRLINFAHKYCKPRTAYRVIGGSFLLAVLLNFHTLLFLGTVNTIDSNPTDIISENKTMRNKSVTIKYEFNCASDEGLYDTFLYPYFDWVDLLFYTIMPFFIMAVCTLIIVKVLYDSKQRLKRKKNQSEALSVIDESKNFIGSSNDVSIQIIKET